MITIEQATEKSGDFYRHRAFYHNVLKMADGKSAVRCRRNGSTKVWKTNDNFSIPVKAGLNNCFYINKDNAAEWNITEIE
jgi:hypothetical protein